MTRVEESDPPVRDLLMEVQAIMAQIAASAFGFAPHPGTATPGQRLDALSIQGRRAGKEFALVTMALDKANTALSNGAMDDCSRSLSVVAASLRAYQNRLRDFAVLDHSAGCGCCISTQTSHPI